MQYPLISEYVRAIQDASNNLDKLAHLMPVLDDHGEPYRSSGAFAVVFKMRDEQTGKYYALKCFTEEQEGRAEAYCKIADELECVDSSYLTSVKYLEKEIFVDSSCEEDEFPVLLMDWIDGETMNVFVEKYFSDRGKMFALFEQFLNFSKWLLKQPFAHGDLKPDNIIIDNNGYLKIIDYDGMYVPQMQGMKSREFGSANFRNPIKNELVFDKNIDVFPIVSILLSLNLIRENSNYFLELGQSDRLMFTKYDYDDLCNSKSYLLTRISRNDGIIHLSDLMKQMIMDENVTSEKLLKILESEFQFSLNSDNEFLQRVGCVVVNLNLVSLIVSPFALRYNYNYDLSIIAVLMLALCVMVYLFLNLLDVMRPFKGSHLHVSDCPLLYFMLYPFGLPLVSIPVLLMSDIFIEVFISNNRYPLFPNFPLYDEDIWHTIIIWGCSYLMQLVLLNISFFDEGNDIYSYRRKNIRTKREKVYDETLQQERSNAYEIRNGIEAKYAEKNENKNEIDVELPF